MIWKRRERADGGQESAAAQGTARASHNHVASPSSPHAASPEGQTQGMLVSAHESGQKLMGFLERRLLLPQPLLHRWIRTGQIRLNGSRVQPFARVSTGDTVRVPPFAGAMSQQARAARDIKERRGPYEPAHREQREERVPREHRQAPHNQGRPSARAAHAPHGSGHGSFGSASAYATAATPATASGRPPLSGAPGHRESGHREFSHREAGHGDASADDVEIIAQDGDYMAVFKPQGLPTQPGTGHVDAVTVRLAHRARAEGLHFVPTPIHRLDRDTSGVLLVARTYNALRYAHEALRAGRIHKEYLVWVHGLWPHEGDLLVRNYMRKGLVGTQERMLVSGDPSFGREALLVARPLRRDAGRTLLHILLLTGRTHQIRAQLSHAGHPVVGDGKYGRAGAESLCLHALRVRLDDGRTFEALPRWKGVYAVNELPPALRH